MAAGSAWVATLLLAREQPNAFVTGKRALTLALGAIAIGIFFLIADLANPAAFFLVLTYANTHSPIAWGARIVTAFALICLFSWALFRNKGPGDVSVGEQAVLRLLQLLALGLAIYPGFVLLQGKAVALWNSWLIVPMVALSGLHAGFAATSFIKAGDVLPAGLKVAERVMLVALLFVTIAFLFGSGISLLGVLFLLIGVLLPLLFILKFPSAVMPASFSVLVGAVLLRAWLITDGQSLFF